MRARFSCGDVATDDLSVDRPHALVFGRFVGAPHETQDPRQAAAALWTIEPVTAIQPVT